jgi:hypothetical protein
MSQMDSLRRRLSPKRLISGDPPPPPPSPLPPGGGQAVGASDLQERRDALARELAELQWDLGGLAYEMAIRDHFRLDVLMRQAGRLQEVDARLGEVEHLLRLDTTGAAGACPRCGTLYARGALFCSHCAFQLVGVQPVGGVMTPAPPVTGPPEAGSGAAPAPEGETAELPAFDWPASASPAAPASPNAPYGLHVPNADDGVGGPHREGDFRVHVPLADETAPAGPPQPLAGQEDEIPSGLRDPRAEDTSVAPEPPGRADAGETPGL